MKKFYALVILICSFTFTAIGQVIISIDNSAPDDAAMLDVKSSDRGLLPPRMTFEQRNSIQNPVEGLMVFCMNCAQNGTGVLSMYQGGKWINISGNCPAPNQPAAATHVPDLTQIVWNWNPVPGATGYKWSAIKSFSTATDMGTNTSKT